LRRRTAIWRRTSFRPQEFTLSSPETSNVRRVLPGWWGAHYLFAELVAAVLATVGVAVWAQGFHGTATVDTLLAGTRAALYGVLATVWGALLGFIIATVTIVLGFLQTPRFKLVRESEHYGDLWKTFHSAIRVLAFATAAAIAALIADKDTPGNPNRIAFYICMFASLLAALRLARCIWILQRVVTLATGPSKARAPGE